MWPLLLLPVIMGASLLLVLLAFRVPLPESFLTVAAFLAFFMVFLSWMAGRKKVAAVLLLIAILVVAFLAMRLGILGI